jgi:hypothetical protein
VVGGRGKGLHGILLHNIWDKSGMKTQPKTEEMRWQVVKAMLDEFPFLKEKTKEYLSKRNPK